MQQMHEELGHFCIHKSHLVLCGQYWWTGKYQQVVAYARICAVCNRASSSFTTLSPQLQSLPIMILDFHWSLDYAGALIVIPCGAKYVLVMVEHFSKWIKIVVFSTELAATTFLDRVLARFGAPTEV